MLGKATQTFSKVETYKPKRHRTSRYDESGRDYACTCGKRYLSRGAMMNHKRTKHSTAQSNDEETGDLYSTLSAKKSMNARKAIATRLKRAEFKSMLERYLGVIPGVFELRRTDPICDFPLELLSHLEARNAYFSNCIKMVELLKASGYEKDGSVAELIDYIGGVDRLSTGEVIALFCIYLSEVVSTQFYKESLLLLLGFGLMVEAVHENGDLADQMHNNASRVNPFCLPEYANEYLMDYYIPLVSTTQIISNLDSLKFFGLEDVQIFRAFLLLHLFCRWLYVYKVTKLKLDKFK